MTDTMLVSTTVSIDGERVCLMLSRNGEPLYVVRLSEVAARKLGAELINNAGRLQDRKAAAVNA